jgi:MFS family permease
MNTQLDQLRNYLSFAKQEIRPLGFGVNFTFLSSFGQTFLLSLFVPHFIDVFGLTKASFGTLYSGLTLTSALVIPLLGGWIDRAPLRLYSLLVMIGIVTGALTTAFAWHLIPLVIGLFLLRLAGQGLSTHTAKTTIGRFYKEKRGKALSIINLGLPVGEGALPLIVTTLLANVSWRATLLAIALLVSIVFVPLQLFLLEKSAMEDPSNPNLSDKNESSGSYFSLGQFNVYPTVLSGLRFWLIGPAVILPAFWITGLFLYQTTLADQVGWSLGLLASAFVTYAITRVACALGVGPAIDRFSARILFPFYLVPFGVGLLFAYFHPGTWSAFAYMSMLGVTMGAGSSIKTALWAELYGESVLGRIRSLFSSLMVFSTSLSPMLLGWLLDAGVAFRTILLWALLTIVLSTLGAFAAVSREAAVK